jgi:fluoride exporter
MDSQIWLVGLGGFLGAITRYWVNLTFTKNRLFPLGTFIVNITGSFLMGILIGNEWIPVSVTLLAGTGFLGAYTTFSTFTFELFLLKKNQQQFLFILYMISSYFLGFLLAGLGYRISS